MAIASSVTTPTANKKRKEVLIDVPPCWDQDFESEIFAPYTKYYRKYALDGSERNQHRIIRYKLYVPVRSSTKIIVEVRLWTEGGRATITDDPLPMYLAAGMQEVVEQGLDFWNNRFKLKISDPNRQDSRCQTKLMEIEYRVVWLDSSAAEEFNDLKQAAKPGFYHSKTLVYENMERERVANGILEIGLTTNTYIAAHEYGHMIGLPDEYPDDDDGRSVVYVKPDGSFDAPVDILAHKEKSSPQAGIMSTAYSFSTVPRHAWCVAIEVQELLSKKNRAENSMRNYTVAVALLIICDLATAQSEVVPLKITVQCVRNPQCAYEGGNMRLELTVTNANSTEISLPVEYISRRGPFIRLIDNKSQQRVSVGTGIPDYTWRSSLTKLASGDSFSFFWTISKSEIEELNGRPVSARAEVTLIDIEGGLDADNKKKYIGRTNFEIRQADVPKRVPPADCGPPN